jgi:hypothetical protein
MKIIFTIEECDDGTMDAKLELHECDIIDALEIIKDAQEEMLQDRISMN